jgi:MobA/MobL family
MVERCERRIDSQLAREIEFALPIELDEAQNIQLAREFIQDQFVLTRIFHQGHRNLFDHRHAA